MPSVTACQLLEHGERGCGNAEVDELNIGTYTLTYQVFTDGILGPQAVANGALSSSPHALPARWSTYLHPTTSESDPLSRARHYSVQADPETKFRWFIAVTFKPADPGEVLIGGTTPINATEIPVNRSPVYWWDREVFNVIVNHDNKGKAIRTKAESLYPDVIEMERARAVLVVEFNVKTAPEVAYYTNVFDGAVNSDTWIVQGITAPPRFALCREVSCGPPMSEIVSSAAYTSFHLIFRFVFAGNQFSGFSDPPVPGAGVTLSGNPWDHQMAEIDDSYWQKNESGVYIVNSEGFRQRFLPEAGYCALNEDGTRRDDGLDVLFTAWRIRREVPFLNLPF
jgi:hypothetical protein